MVYFLALLFCLPGFAKEGGTEALDAYKKLQEGNSRFVMGQLKHPNQNITVREMLANGQKPHTIVLSCSDSRVPPELVFDQGLGDIFPIRVAGNVINAEGIASIEYAVEHLGAKLILVMGHESCGAVGAAVNTPHGKSAGSENLDILVGKIQKNIGEESMQNAKTDKTFHAAVKDNVKANLIELLQKSEIIREAVKHHGVMLAKGIYSLKTGKVEIWDFGRIPNFMASEKMGGPAIKSSVVHADNIKPAIAPEKKEKKQEAVVH